MEKVIISPDDHTTSIAYSLPQQKKVNSNTKTKEIDINNYFISSSINLIQFIYLFNH